MSTCIWRGGERAPCGWRRRSSRSMTTELWGSKSNQRMSRFLTRNWRTWGKRRGLMWTSCYNNITRSGRENLNPPAPSEVQLQDRGLSWSMKFPSVHLSQKKMSSILSTREPFRMRDHINSFKSRQDVKMFFSVWYTYSRITMWYIMWNVMWFHATVILLKYRKWFT